MVELEEEEKHKNTTHNYKNNIDVIAKFKAGPSARRKEN